MLRRARLRSAEQRRAGALGLERRLRRLRGGHRWRTGRPGRQRLAARQHLDVVPSQRLALEQRGGDLVEQAEIRLFFAAFVDTSQWFEDGDNEVVVRGGTYADGRPVQTRIEWEGGYATIVHPPDPQDEESRPDPNELAEECWDGDALGRAQLMDDDADEEDAP